MYPLWALLFHERVLPRPGSVLEEEEVQVSFKLPLGEENASVMAPGLF